MSSLLAPLTESPVVADAVRKNGIDVQDKGTAKDWFQRRIRNQRVANRTVSAVFPAESATMADAEIWHRVPRRGGRPAARSMSPLLREAGILVYKYWNSETRRVSMPRKASPSQPQICSRTRTRGMCRLYVLNIHCSTTGRILRGTVGERGCRC
jgi:hypothetical protein